MKIKIPLVLLLTLVMALPFIHSCKRLKKGTLEIMHEVRGPGGSEYYYLAIVVEDDLYEPGVEIVLPAAANGFDYYYGYYWPDESPLSLGYTKKCRSYTDEIYFTSKSECLSIYPSDKGYWATKTNTSGGGSCPVGTWYAPACGDPKGVVWKFGSDGKGSFSNKDCNGVCTPMVFTFSYKMSGSTCSITYDSQQPIVKCTGYADSRPPAPKNTSITITCDGSTMTVTSGNGTQKFTK